MTTTGTGARTSAQVLAEARRADSLRKRGRVLAELERMLAADEPVSFAALARNAHVSTWLVYSHGLRDQISGAITRQERQPARQAATGTAASTNSLRTELLLAREEITALRTARDRLRAALRHQLGEQLDQTSQRTLYERIDELTRQLRERERAENAACGEAEQLRTRAAQLEADLDAARTSLRAVLRDINTNRPPIGGPEAAAGRATQPSAVANATVQDLPDQPRSVPARRRRLPSGHAEPSGE